MARTFEEPNSSNAANTASTPLHEPNIRMPSDDTDTASQNTKNNSSKDAYVTPAAAPKASIDYKEMQPILENMKTNFIFPVGMPTAGKTVALYSMLRYLMIEESPGQIHPFDSPWEAADETNIILKEIDILFREKTLPRETSYFLDATNQTKQANYEFEPHKKLFPKLRMTFVDLSGEHYKDFVDDGKFAAGVDVFFNVRGLSLTFLLMTSHEQAARDDSLFKLFLGHIAKHGPEFKKARVAIVITKWDTYAGEESVDQFVKKSMPTTYAATRNLQNALMSFTVGSVGKNADGKTDWLQQYNPAPAAILFKWIYQSITTKNLDTKPWWQRFLKGI